jgi:hypothetical protein
MPTQLINILKHAPSVAHAFQQLRHSTPRIICPSGNLLHQQCFQQILSTGPNQGNLPSGIL